MRDSGAKQITHGKCGIGHILKFCFKFYKTLFFLLLCLVEIFSGNYFWSPKALGCQKSLETKRNFFLKKNLASRSFYFLSHCPNKITVFIRY